MVIVLSYFKSLIFILPRYISANKHRSIVLTLIFMQMLCLSHLAEQASKQQSLFGKNID